MVDKQVVLGIFADEAAADAAAEALRAWDRATDGIRLGAVGVLVADEQGRIKEDKLGARSEKTGAGIGLVLAVLFPPTLLAGIVGGGVLGHFHHQGLNLTADDFARVGRELAGGKAAVGVIAASDAEAGVISAELSELGGDVEVHTVTDEALEAVAAAAAESEVPASPEAPATA